MIKEATISEDFTFPTITENNSLYQLHFPSFTSSSLWYVSSAVSDLSDPKQLREEEGGSGGGGGEEFGFLQKTHQRRSFSSVEGCKKKADNLTKELESSLGCPPNLNGGDEKQELVRDEETMDLLWEDFNDHEPSLPSPDKRRKGEKVKERSGDSTTRYESDNDDARQVADLYCVRALKMSKSSGILHHRRPTSLLVMLKVLKKLFFIQNSRTRHQV